MTNWLLFFEPSTWCLLLCAATAISFGCHLSNTSSIFTSTQQVQQIKPVTAIAAISLPILGSIALILLFYFMNIIRYLLLVVLGIGSFSSLLFLLEPFSDRLVNFVKFFSSHKHKTWISFFISSIPSLGITILWACTLYWPISNFLAICIGIVAIGLTRLPSLRVCFALLSAFFIYDIFWVFFSSRLFGQSVMITVAQGLAPSGQTSYPALLTFPTFINSGGKSMLGMGDILLPGLCLCYLHRVDTIKHNFFLGKSNPNINHKIGYFPMAFVMYFAGLFVTFGVLITTGSGQPALLYLVPAVLGSACIQSLINKEFLSLWKGVLQFQTTTTITQPTTTTTSSSV